MVYTALGKLLETYRKKALDHNYVIENIIQKLGCPEDEARKYLHDYLASRTYRLDHDEAVDIMEKLIAIDSGYVSMLRDKIREAWEQEQTELLKKAQEEIENKRKALHSIEEKAQIEVAKIEDARQKQLELQQEAEEMMQLKDDVEQHITKRLQDIREDRAAALVDSAFMQAAIQPESIPASPENGAKPTSSVQMDIDVDKEERPLREAMLDILEACADLCGNDQDAIEQIVESLR